MALGELRERSIWVQCVEDLPTYKQMQNALILKDLSDQELV